MQTWSAFERCILLPNVECASQRALDDDYKAIAHTHTTHTQIHIHSRRACWVHTNIHMQTTSFFPGSSLELPRSCLSKLLNQRLKTRRFNSHLTSESLWILSMNNSFSFGLNHYLEYSMLHNLISPASPTSSNSRKVSTQKNFEHAHTCCNIKKCIEELLSNVCSP